MDYVQRSNAIVQFGVIDLIMSSIVRCVSLTNETSFIKTFYGCRNGVLTQSGHLAQFRKAYIGRAYIAAMSDVVKNIPFVLVEQEHEVYWLYYIEPLVKDELLTLGYYFTHVPPDGIAPSSVIPRRLS